MKLKKIFRLRIVNLFFWISVIFIVGGCIWAIIILGGISEPLIIHYSQSSGIDRIGGLGTLIGIAVLGLIMAIVDFFISLELEKKNILFSRLTSLVGLFVGFLIFIYFAAIISIN